MANGLGGDRMIDFTSLQKRLEEKRASAVVFTFGRFQPPTSGHELLINETIKEAKKRGAEARIYTSKGNKNKATKNPLKFRDKVSYLKKFFPKANIMSADTAFAVCEQLTAEGVRDVVMVVGDDRVKEFKDGISKYIGPDGYDFDSFDVVSAGARDPEAAGVVGMSASKMRAAVSNNNFKSFKVGLPSSAKDRDAHKLFDLLQKEMGIKEEVLSEGISNTQLKTISKNKEVKELLKDFYREPHETIAVALLSLPYVEDIIGTLSSRTIEQFIDKIPAIMSFANITSQVKTPNKPTMIENISAGNSLRWVTDPLVPMVSLIEKEEKEKDDIIVIALSKGEGGDTRDTVTKIEKSCKDKNIPFHSIRVGEAYVVDDDLNDDKMVIYNYDAKGNDLDIKASKTCCFVRGGALVEIAGRGIAKTLEEAGVFMINNMSSMEQCQNKFSTSITLQKAGILHPKTALVTNEESIEVVHEKIGAKFPVVVKTITGAEGIGVMIVDSMASLKSVLQGLWKYNAELIVQEYMEIDFDVRTLVLDGKIHASVKRLKTNKNDFRTNKSLGNKTEAYILNDKEKKIILKAASVSGCYYCGVDHVVVNGENLILEVNGSPGSGADPYMSYYKKDKKISGQGMIDNVVDYISIKDNWDKTKTTVGVVENVVIEGMNFKAKMDTGNGSYTSIHATDIKKLSDTKVSFKIENKKFTKTIEGMKNITLSGGTKPEKRFVIKLSLGFGTGKISDTYFTLDDRSGNVYPVLVGKRELLDRGYIVDVSKKYTIA